MIEARLKLLGYPQSSVVMGHFSDGFFVITIANHGENEGADFQSIRLLETLASYFSEADVSYKLMVEFDTKKRVNVFNLRITEEGYQRLTDYYKNKYQIENWAQSELGNIEDIEEK